jgi:hypothetical protein
MRSEELKKIILNLDPLYRALDEHPVYAWALESPANLRFFMETHVWAVWDFMSLLKSLQRNLTSVQHPWRPVKNARAARFINEIVLGEESDLLADGLVTSHFELYLEAMKEVGANTAPIHSFVDALDDSWLESLKTLAPSVAVFNFVSHTLESSEKSIAWVAGAFLMGRESLVPRLFRPLLKEIESRGAECPRLKLYLERHIELDGDHHGPLSELLIEELCRGDHSAWADVQASAESSLKARKALWDSIFLSREMSAQLAPLNSQEC